MLNVLDIRGAAGDKVAAAFVTKRRAQATH